MFRFCLRSQSSSPYIEIHVHRAKNCSVEEWGVAQSGHVHLFSPSIWVEVESRVLLEEEHLVNEVVHLCGVFQARAPQSSLPKHLDW